MESNDLGNTSKAKVRVRKPRNQKGSGGVFWNLLTVLMLMGIILMIAIFAVIFVNPYIFFNPFPPPEVPVALNFPTNTPTPLTFPSTWTPTATLQPSATPQPPPATPTPTQFVLNSLSQTPVSDTTGTPEVLTGMPYAFRGTPAVIASTIYHPDEGCNWLGVGGQAFDLSGAPIVGIVVQVGGSLAGNTINIPSLTGTAIQYGPAGYEIKLADRLIPSTDTLWIQLLDQAGLPLTEKVYFDTQNDCQKNLVLVNFRQVR